MGEDRLDLGAKDDSVRQLRVVERFDADAVPGEEQLPPTRIPDRKGEHPVEVLDAARPVLLVEMDDGLAVSPRPVPVTFALKIGAQRFVVVDLAVVDDPHTAVLVGHRLMAGARQVDDRQPAMAQGDALALADNHPLVVGSAVYEGVAHPHDCGRVDSEVVVEAEDAANPAHAQASVTDGLAYDPRAVTLELSRRASASALRLLRAAGEAEFRGADPYDALWWPHWPRALVAGRRRRTALVQLHARSPVDIRRLYRRQHSLIPKTLAVFGSAALRLSGQDELAAEARRIGTQALELLAADQTNGLHGWSYPWDVQTRWSFYAAGTPNIVSTAYGSRALAAVAGPWQRPAWEERARGAARWVRDDLLQPAGYFAYHPRSTVLVHNANLLGAELVHSQLGADHIVSRAVELTLQDQRSDGSWPYGTGIDFADSFHTGYVLECLSRVRGLDSAIDDALRRGTAYWLDHFFLADGTATLWPDRRWPEDAHATGTALTTLSELVTAGFADTERLADVTRYALERMLVGDHAVPRRYRIGRARVAYIRWCDAHMALGLANGGATLAGSQTRDRRDEFPHKRVIPS